MTFRPLGVLLVAVVAFFAGRASDGIDIPKPGPAPIVDPTPNPVPVPGDGLFVMVVREATDGPGMTPAQLSAIESGEFARYLKAKNARWRKFDRDVPPDLESPLWRDAWEKYVKPRPKEAFPLLIVSNGKAGSVDKLPPDLPGLMAAVKKYGGAL